MINEIQSFRPITACNWLRLKAHAAVQLNAWITDDSGVVTTAIGVVIRYVYNAASEELTIQILNKPWIISEELIQQRIHTMAERFMGDADVTKI